MPNKGERWLKSIGICHILDSLRTRTISFYLLVRVNISIKGFVNSSVWFIFIRFFFYRWIEHFYSLKLTVDKKSIFFLSYLLTYFNQSSNRDKNEDFSFSFSLFLCLMLLSLDIVIRFILLVVGQCKYQALLSSPNPIDSSFSFLLIDCKLCYCIDIDQFISMFIDRSLSSDR